MDRRELIKIVSLGIVAAPLIPVLTSKPDPAPVVLRAGVEYTIYVDDETGEMLGTGTIEIDPEYFTLEFIDENGLTIKRNITA
jgi:hypothetical protein